MDGRCPSLRPSPLEELIRLPKAWFMDPLRASMRTLVRPCTGLTRRKQLTIKAQLPARCFEDLLACLPDGSVEGLERDYAGRLVPTSTTGTMRKFNYTIRRATQLDKLFALQHYDKPQGKQGGSRWRRSVGSARLFLSQAAARRGQMASVMAMVCGNLVIDFREPKAFARMPRLTLRMFVLSMDSQGHIVWPVDFEPRTKAALRKQARALVSIMLESPESYPMQASSCSRRATRC